MKFRTYLSQTLFHRNWAVLSKHVWLVLEIGSWGTSTVMRWGWGGPEALLWERQQFMSTALTCVSPAQQIEKFNRSLMSHLLNFTHFFIRAGLSLWRAENRLSSVLFPQLPAWCLACWVNEFFAGQVKACSRVLRKWIIRPELEILRKTSCGWSLWPCYQRRFWFFLKWNYFLNYKPYIRVIQHIGKYTVA